MNVGHITPVNWWWLRFGVVHPRVHCGLKYRIRDLIDDATTSEILLKEINQCKEEQQVVPCRSILLYVISDACSHFIIIHLNQNFEVIPIILTFLCNSVVRELNCLYTHNDHMRWIRKIRRSLWWLQKHMFVLVTFSIDNVPKINFSKLISGKIFKKFAYHFLLID